jgi:hypothetical protein
MVNLGLWIIAQLGRQNEDAGNSGSVLHGLFMVKPFWRTVVVPALLRLIQLPLLSSDFFD